MNLSYNRITMAKKCRHEHIDINFATAMKAWLATNPKFFNRNHQRAREAVEGWLAARGYNP